MLYLKISPKVPKDVELALIRMICIWGLICEF